MRQSTKSVIGVLSLGVLASSYSIGLAQANDSATLSSGLSASGKSGAAGTTSDSSTSESTSTATESATANPGASASATESATASPSASASASPSATASKAATKSTATPTATATATPTSTPTASAAPKATASSNKQTGEAIYYKYGTIQLTVTKASGKISSVDVVIGTTKGREYSGVISELVPAAVSANGSNFGNYSGATFTTDAFKQALESALAKF